MGIGDHFPDVVDRSARYPRLPEKVAPLIHRAKRQPGGQQLFHLGVVAGAQLVGREALVLAQFRRTDGLAQRPPQAVVAGGDHEVPVSGPEELERRDRRVAAAQRRRHLAGDVVAGDGVLEQGDLAVEHGDIEVLPLACLPGSAPGRRPGR